MTKYQLPLRWKLMLGMLGVGAILASTIFTIFFSSISGFRKELDQFVLRETSAHGRTVAAVIAPLLQHADKDSISNQLQRYVKKNKSIAGILVLNNQMQTYVTMDIDRRIAPFMEQISELKHDSPTPLDDALVAVRMPIRRNGATAIGEVAIVVDRSTYSHQKDHSIPLFIIVTIICVVLAAGSAFIVGDRLTRPINALVQAAERFASGDLTQLHVAKSDTPEMKRLAAAVEQMAVELQSQVIAIKELTLKISSMSAMTEKNMTDLATSAAEQAAAVTGTATTVEVLAKTEQDTATNAKNIVVAAEKTAAVSARGRQIIDHTSDIMKDIQAESRELVEKSKILLTYLQEVGEIIQSVNAIAEQSQILAVNASIEAASAGEFGAGFAVVAQEVKELGTQSKNATLQISGTIASIRSAIEAMEGLAQRGKDRSAQGVLSIANAGTIMHDLIEAIQENSNYAKLIATNIQQQHSGLSQIASAIVEIHTSAFSNQNISTSIVSATKEINDSLALLKQKMDRWQTRDQKSSPTASPENQ
jgi:methyl-accepting chemotaxis protein